MHGKVLSLSTLHKIVPFFSGGKTKKRNTTVLFRFICLKWIILIGKELFARGELYADAEHIHGGLQLVVGREGRRYADI